MEKVIFRTEYDPYRKARTYLAVFPECSANPGFYAGVPFYFNGDKAVFEPFCEIAYGYYYGNTRIVHKNASEIGKLLSAIEEYYGEKYKVCEKIH